MSCVSVCLFQLSYLDAFSFLLSILQAKSIHPYHIPLILLRGGFQHIVRLPCCRSKNVHSDISAPQKWPIHTISRGMIIGILIVRRHHRHEHATIITLTDIAATSRPSHITPICIARIHKATMTHTLPTSISTTRFPSTKRRPVSSEQTRDLHLQCPHPCHHSSNTCP